MMLVRTLALGALLCAASVAHAGDKPLYQPAPDWVVPAPDPDAARLTDADPAAVIFDQQQRVRDGQVWAYTDQAMRVVSPQMMTEVGTLQLPWQPDAGDLIIHRAEIIRGGEHIDLIAKGQHFEVLRREEQLEQYQINGTLTATLAVEGLRVGDVLRLRYSVTSKDKALQGNAQTTLALVSAPQRVGFARARLSWPADSDLKWRSYADAPAPKVVERNGFDEIEIALPLAKPAEVPGDAPARFRKPQILEATNFASWEAVSRAMAPLYRTEGLIAPGGALAAEVDKIKARSGDPRTRAALALRLVQDEIRYLFQGMNGGNYTPQSPADTWSRRYGDCKAKTLLLLAILHALDIEAEPVLANSQMGDMVPMRLPSAGAFDHVLVRATIAGQTLWLDGTTGGTRLADLGDAPPFGNVLPVREAGAGLMPVPMHAAARPMMEATVDMDQSAGLSLPTPFTVSFIARGPLAEMLRAMSSQANKEQLSGMAQGMVNSVLGDALIAERTLAYDADSATATLTAKGMISTPWKMERGRYRTTLDKSVAMLTFEPDRARPPWKDIPVMSTPAAAGSVYRVRVRLPAGGAGFTLEGDRTLPPVLAGTPIVRKTELAGGMVSLEDRIESDGREIAAADLPAARAQVALAKTRLLEAVGPADYPPRWKIVSDAAKSGALAPILAIYAKAIADEPEKTLSYTNRASFWAGVWKWKNAIADLDKAIAIEPDADLYFWRARLKSSIGDDKGARADAEAGLALAPGSAVGINQLATLRFRAGERDAALAMLDERIQAGGKEGLGFVSQKAELLGEAGRAGEGVALLDETIRANPGNANLLNSRCWLKGTTNTALDTALKDCTRAIEIAENPAAIYDSRAMVYFRMGRMQEALDDLNAALDVAPGQTASLYLRGMTRRRLGDAKGGDADLAAARLMSPRIDEDYARYGIKP